VGRPAPRSRRDEPQPRIPPITAAAWGLAVLAASMLASLLALALLRRRARR